MSDNLRDGVFDMDSCTADVLRRRKHSFNNQLIVLCSVFIYFALDNGVLFPFFYLQWQIAYYVYMQLLYVKLRSNM